MITFWTSCSVKNNEEKKLLDKIMRVDIIQAESRFCGPETQFIENLRITGNGMLCINKHRFCPSGFLLETDSLKVCIDPVMPFFSGTMDYIIITHGHPDHFSLKDIRLLAGKKTVIFTPENLGPELEGLTWIPMGPGQTYSHGTFSLTAHKACNTRNVFLWLKAHKDNSQTLGYTIQMGEVRIFHPGDTDYLPELAKIPLVDVLFVPIGNKALTMGPIEAASLTEALSPKAVIPMHYEPDQDYLSIFQKKVPENISVLRFY